MPRRDPERGRVRQKLILPAAAPLWPPARLGFLRPCPFLLPVSPPLLCSPLPPVPSRETPGQGGGRRRNAEKRHTWTFQSKSFRWLPPISLQQHVSAYSCSRDYP